MRSALAQRLRSSSLSAVPPPQNSSDYSLSLAKVAASILYRTPIPTRSGHAIYVLNVAALPDADSVEFDKLLPYVLARLPGEEELLEGKEYEVILFAGGNPESATSGRKSRPGWGWFIQAYHVLSRAMRKRLQKLYIVHEKSWVRVLVEMFSTIVSHKFRRKIIHVSTLSGLALHLPIEDLLIPPSAYLYDRRLTPYIHSPYASGRRAFAVKQPLPLNTQQGTRLPRVLRETTRFILQEPNIQTEGIFRVPAHARLREILKESYDRGQKYIIWKEQNVQLPVPRYPRADGTERILEEVDLRDAYGVLSAAGLMKLWYSELRQPLFPNGMYKELRTQYSNREEDLTIEKLTTLISPESEWSPLPHISREILTRHLLPLLSVVASRQDQNKMTPENLAVCFAPALLCGPDQVEDAKMSSVIRYILTAAITAWEPELRSACNVSPTAFETDIQEPTLPSDWEDPLDAPRRPLESEENDHHEDEKHFTGIIMQDNDDAPEPEAAPPALPPRRTNPDTVSPTATTYAKTTAPSPQSTGTGTSDDSQTRRFEERSRIRDGEASFDSFVGQVDGKVKGKDGGGGVSDALNVKEEREVLTSEQVDSLNRPKEKNATYHGLGGGQVALPGMVDPAKVADAVRRKPLMPSASAVAGVDGEKGENEGLPSYRATGHQTSRMDEKSGHVGVDLSALALDTLSAAPTAFLPSSAPTASPSTSTNPFRKPSLPASATRHLAHGQPPQPQQLTTPIPPSSASTSAKPTNRTPSFSSLAKPIIPIQSPYTLPSPTLQSPTLLTSPSTSTFPKPRTPSPSLLLRMPSFETPRPPPSTTTAPVGIKRSSTLGTDPMAPRKIDMRRESVEDLRRLFEERGVVARGLVGVGKGSGPRVEFREV